MAHVEAIGALQHGGFWLVEECTERWLDVTRLGRSIQFVDNPVEEGDEIVTSRWM